MHCISRTPERNACDIGLASYAIRNCTQWAYYPVSTPAWLICNFYFLSQFMYMCMKAAGQMVTCCIAA